MVKVGRVHLCRVITVWSHRILQVMLSM